MKKQKADKAAAKVQSAARGKLVRKELAHQHESAAQIQALWRARVVVVVGGGGCWWRW